MSPRAVLDSSRTGPSRRAVLRTAAFASVAAVGLTGLRPAAAVGRTTAVGRGAAAGATAPQWNGHKPGQIYLGMAAQGAVADAVGATGPVGLSREYYSWGSGSGEIRDIQVEHAAARLPWVSFRPPTELAGAWSAVAAGTYDDDLRARAQRYAQLTRPVIVTFSHEPQCDAQIGTPAQFAAAWVRTYDVMKAETGLKNVVAVPILGEWAFNPYNKGPDPQEYLTPDLLARCDFLGVDLYQNRSCQGYDIRLARILAFLDSSGFSNKMVGLGETGACNTYSTKMTAAQWWTSCWGWAAAHTDRVGAISYFNSLAFNNSGNNWLLSESSEKLAAYRASLASPIACRL